MRLGNENVQQSHPSGAGEQGSHCVSADRAGDRGGAQRESETVTWEGKENTNSGISV